MKDWYLTDDTVPNWLSHVSPERVALLRADLREMEARRAEERKAVFDCVVPALRAELDGNFA